MNSDKPLVSVLMITYNHEKYISQAIESALIQETDFNYEIVIGEDSSTDNTREIVLDYAKRFPQRIRLILHQRNIGVRANLSAVHQACYGKYIAILEGDDYWIDPLKLQKQVNLLEANPNCSECHTKAKILCEKGYTLRNAVPKRHIKKHKDTKKILLRNFIKTATCMYRNNNCIDFNYIKTDFWANDWLLHVQLSNYGSICFLNEVTAVYRLHSKGETGRLNLVKTIPKKILVLEELDKFFKGKYKKLIRLIISREFATLSKEYAKNGNKQCARKHLLKSYRVSLFNRYAFCERLKAILALYAPKIFAELEDFRKNRRL